VNRSVGSVRVMRYLLDRVEKLVELSGFVQKTLRTFSEESPSLSRTRVVAEDDERDSRFHPAHCA
jgi:hypothetical protein